MRILSKTLILSIVGLTLPAAIKSQVSNTIIEYNVINLLNQSESMGVRVDNVTYPLPLNASSDTSILYSGKAPAARSEYKYVRFCNDNTSVAEPFNRKPVTHNTPNEFFNRTWNTYKVATFPQIYAPLSAIHRIKIDLHKEGQIPTIHLVGNQEALDLMHHNSTADITVMTNISYVGLNDVLSYKEVELSLAGRSSRWLPKLSYNVKLKKKDKLFDNRRVKLRALATDPSYIREQLAYDIVNSTGLASAGFSYVRVFMNNQELGLFGIIEKFKDTWLANIFGNGSTKHENGYLYQGVFQTPQSAAQNQTSDLSFVNNITAYGLGQYKIKQEASKGKKVDWRPLMDFTKFIATAPINTSDAVSKWNKQLDTDSFLRSMALEVLLGYADGYFSIADNYYVYQNLQTKKFFWISSDMDLTFGSTMFKLQDMWSGNYSTYPGFDTRPLMKQMMEVPQFKQTYNGLLRNITHNLVNPNKTNTRINDLVNMIREDVAWDKTLEHVGYNIMGDAMMADTGENNTSSILSAVIGSSLPQGMDLATSANMALRINASISLMTAVDGPTGYISLSGVKEWISNVHQNVTNFYSE